MFIQLNTFEFVMLDGLPYRNDWFIQSPPDPPSHDKGSATAQVGVTTHRWQAQPLETARVGSLSQYAHALEVHEGVPTPETKLESGTRGAALCADASTLPRPLLMVTRSHPLSCLRSLSFPHHGLAMGYSHTRLFLWDFVEGSAGRTTENVHVSRSLSKYHQGPSKLMTTPVKSCGSKVRRHQGRLGPWER